MGTPQQCRIAWTLVSKARNIPRMPLRISESFVSDICEYSSIHWMTFCGISPIPFDRECDPQFCGSERFQPAKESGEPRNDMYYDTHNRLAGR